MIKQTIFGLLVCGTMLSCSEEQKPTTEATEENKDLLSTELVNNPRTAEGMTEEEIAAMPTMSFTDTVYDFGTIKEGDVATHEYEFTNNGKNPLIISNAKGSCGCTVPEYPTAPIPPGKSGKIKVQFNSQGREGHQEKSVTLQTNSKKGIHTLFIKGDVNK